MKGFGENFPDAAAGRSITARGSKEWGRMEHSIDWRLKHNDEGS